MMNKLTKQLGAALLAGALCLSLAVPAFAAESAPATRGAFATAIWAQEGKDSVTPAAPFTDVANGDKNYTAILWCAENGVVNGTGKGSFFPADAITREQAAIMVQNLAGHNGDGIIAEADLSSYSDASAVAPWAVNALKWAVAKGILTAQDGKLNPKGTLSTEEVQAMLARYSITAQSTHTIGLTGVENARDVGGYVTADGRTVKYGLLLRTGKLSDATEADLARLTGTYGLTTVIDFRTTAEIKEGPDPAMQGVTNTQINILGDDPAGGAAITSIYGSDPLQGLIDIVKTGQTGPDMYTSIIQSEQALKGYRQFFSALLSQKEGALLWHCTGGKDRAGTAAVLLLSALGVDRNTVLQDFVLTNDFNAQKIAYMGAQTAAKGEDAATVQAVKDLVGVNGSYMAAMLDLIDSKFGSMDAFLTAPDGMALTSAQLTTLRDMYLTK